MVTFQMPVFSCPCTAKSVVGSHTDISSDLWVSAPPSHSRDQLHFFFSTLKKKSIKLLSVHFNDDDGFHYIGKFAVGSGRFGADNEVFVYVGTNYADEQTKIKKSIRFAIKVMGGDDFPARLLSVTLPPLSASLLT